MPEARAAAGLPVPSSTSTRRAAGRVAAARRLGPGGALRATRRWTRSTRRQFALACDVSSRERPPPIPAITTLGPVAPTAFTGFSDLTSATEPEDLLELLWYVRFATEGHVPLLVARDRAGRPTFSTWMLDARGQQRARYRFWSGFHELDPEEMLLEGVFTFPAARGHGVARAGIQAACSWAAAQGARRVWAYPYTDKPWMLPLLAHAGFRADHARIETISLGRVRGRSEPLTRHDLEIWEDAARIAAGMRRKHAPPSAKASPDSAGP